MINRVSTVLGLSWSEDWERVENGAMFRSHCYVTSCPWTTWKDLSEIQRYLTYPLGSTIVLYFFSRCIFERVLPPNLVLLLKQIRQIWQPFLLYRQISKVSFPIFTQIPWYLLLSCNLWLWLKNWNKVHRNKWHFGPIIAEWSSTRAWGAEARCQVSQTFIFVYIVCRCF